MKTSVVVSSLILVSAITGVGVYSLNSTDNQNNSFPDTDGDGVPNINDTYIFNPQCASDSDKDGICDAEEGSFNQGSDEALQISLSTSKDQYSRHEDFTVNLTAENLAKVETKNIDYRIRTGMNLKDPRYDSQPRRDLSPGQSTDAVLSTGTDIGSDEGSEREMEYSGIFEAEAITDYRTSATSSLKLVSFENATDTSRKQFQTANDGGPVIMKLSTSSPKPVRITANSVQFDVSGNVRNLGAGEIVGPNQGSAVELSLGFPNIPNSTKTTCEKEVSLEVGENVFMCSFDLDERALNTHLTLKGDLKYRYSTSAEKTVQIQG